MRTGFEENADTGKLVHGVLGWDKLAPESMAMYQAGRGTFRLASKPAAEARMWMIEGFAGGIQPWWHHIGAYHEDRRMYRTAEPVMKWYAANEQYLVNRRPLATVGHGLVAAQHGFLRAAIAPPIWWTRRTAASPRAWCAREFPMCRSISITSSATSADLKVLILPNMAAMSDAQCAAVRKFVAGGGALIATGVTSLYNEIGDARGDYGLAELFGAHFTGTAGAERAVGDADAAYLSAAQPGTAGRRVWAENRRRAAASPASGMRFCAASKRPTSCRSGER